jgi:ABC-type transport system involved in multi-copper enzyme maturation permease subunit
MTMTLSVGFGNLLQSEWTKLRSLRSTFWCTAIIAVSIFGIAILMGVRWADVLASDPPDKRAGFDATNTVLSGVYIAQVIVGAMGVLTISGEYGTGMIRASLAAVPQRRTLLLAKLLVLAAAVFVLSEALSFGAFAAGQALLDRKGFGTSLSDPGVLRAVTGAGLYLTAVALLGFGLGALIRHTAGALSTFFGVLFALTVLSDLLPTSWRNDVINYMPANAGSQIFTVVPVHDALSPWTGLAVFCCYAVAALIAAFALIEYRDA